MNLEIEIQHKRMAVMPLSHSLEIIYTFQIFTSP